MEPTGPAGLCSSRRLELPNGELAVERLHLLTRTHWLRVAIVTAYGALTLWMFARSAWLASIT